MGKSMKEKKPFEEIPWEKTFSLAPCPIAILDEKGDFLFANAEFRALFSDDVPSFWSLVSPDFLQALREHFSRLSSSEPLRLETSLVQDGKEMPAMVSFRTVEDGVILMHVVDLRPFRQKEKEMEGILQRTERLLESLAGGMLAEDTEAVSGAAFRVQAAYNDAVASLAEIIEGIRQLSGLVAHSAEELALGQQDMCQRLEQEAASLEEISTILRATSDAFRLATANAQQSDSLAKSLAEDAQGGQEVILRTAEVMGRIGEEAGTMKKILAAIEKIAKRTYIISLNASVEAAHAGAAGKGFSIIATEVRALSEKVSGQTQTIREWVDKIGTEVEAGQKAMEEATGRMAGFVEKSREVSQRMKDISEKNSFAQASLEQNSTEVQRLEAGLSQSAAMTEEVSRLVESLSQKTQEMRSSVEVFFLPEKKEVRSDFLAKAIRTHLRWKARLLGMIEKGETTVPAREIANDTACDFGRWLDGAPSYLKKEARFAALKKAHRHFHQTAAMVANLIEEKNLDTARRMLDEDYALAEKEVMDALESLRPLLESPALH